MPWPRVLIGSATKITRDPISIPAALVSHKCRRNSWDKEEVQRSQVCLFAPPLFFFTGWLQLNEPFLHTLRIKPSTTNWFDIHYSDPFSLLSDLFSSKTCSSHLSKQVRLDAGKNHCLICGILCCRFCHFYYVRVGISGRYPKYCP